MFQDVFIIGATGKVGAELINQIILNDGVCANKHANPTRVVGVASSKTYLYNKNGLNRHELIGFSKKEIFGKEYGNVLELIDIIDANLDNIFIDVTAGKEEMLNFHLKVINETKFRIVTANKNPLVLCDTKTFRSLIKDARRYGYRCSVMAGAEAVGKMVDLTDLGDVPKSISGCFSGTLGYLTSELETGTKLSSAVAKAVELGFTEPNPVVDLNGGDVARKMLILVRSAGFKMDYEDIELMPFVSNELLKSNSIEELLLNLKKADNDFEKKFLVAKNKNNTFRFVGEFDSSKNKVIVGLKEVKIDSPLGQLKGNSNKIVVVTDVYTSKNPYVVESPGAGLKVTAQNIRRDLLSMLDGRQIGY
jgi:homoserine dehydrogenase